MCRLNPRVDFAFKKLFGSEENKDLLISLINSVVDEKVQVKDIILKNPYNPKNFSKDKLSILNIKAQCVKGTWYNIEIQITDYDYYDKRALYYWSSIYTSQLKEDISYDKLEKTIVIKILNFNCIDEEGYHNVYNLLNRVIHKELIEHIELHFIELEKYDKDLTQIKTTLDRWVEFLKRAHEYNKNKIPPELSEVKSIEKAGKVLDAMYLDDVEREVYEGRLKCLKDKEMAIKKAKKVGREEGIEEEKEKTAKRLLTKGMDVEFVVEVTELPLEKVELLEEEISKT